MARRRSSCTVSGLIYAYRRYAVLSVMGVQERTVDGNGSVSDARHVRRPEMHHWTLREPSPFVEAACQVLVSHCWPLPLEKRNQKRLTACATYDRVQRVKSPILMEILTATVIAGITTERFHASVLSHAFPSSCSSDSRGFPPQIGAVVMCATKAKQLKPLVDAKE